MARDLRVRLIGDSRSLERAYAKAEASSKRFNKTITAQGRAQSAIFSSINARFGAAAAGAGAIALIKSSIDATREAEVVLGQTSIAVQDAGLSWQQYAKTVDAASTRISEASAFDDEAVLQSFQVFVRGQKDVQRSLQLSELAADVARGRYTDLETATNLVNKAAMGQIGALRRAGIAIDKNATSAEALDALLRAYGGSAQKYADSAAGSSDKLRVAWENLTEQAGGPLSSALAQVASELTTIVEMGQKAGAIKLPSLPGMGGGSTLGGLASKVGGYLLMPGLAPVFISKAIIDRIRGGGGAPKPGDPDFIGPVKPPGFGRSPFAGFTTPGAPAAKKKKAAAGPAGISADQRNAWFDAMIGRDLTDVQDVRTIEGQIGRLREISAQVTARIAITKDITRKLTLEDQVKQIARDIRGKQGDIAAAVKARAEDLAAAAKAAKEKAKQAAADVAEAAKAAKAAAAEAKRQATETRMGWLDFAVERAGATKTIKDDVAAYRRLEAVLVARIGQEGRTLDLVRQLWETRQKIADLNRSKAGTDPLAGLMQVSSSKLANILAAGTGLSGAGRRVLGANIAGAEIRPMHIHLNVDGRELTKVVTTGQARGGNRTANQTSGRRG